MGSRTNLRINRPQCRRSSGSICGASHRASHASANGGSRPLRSRAASGDDGGQADHHDAADARERRGIAAFSGQQRWDDGRSGSHQDANLITRALRIGPGLPGGESQSDATRDDDPCALTMNCIRNDCRASAPRESRDINPQGTTRPAGKETAIAIVRRRPHDRTN